ncbi:MAG: M1 family metallopeptidase, partial [Hymenobacteraceae bacterium]|nr:M1 family metallopeptidase [Hymenobacteraceae bacterium]
HAPYLTMMAIGDFAVVKDKWRNMEVSYYVEPAFKNTAKAVFGNTPEMLEFFSKKLGVDYPWDKYAQVVVRDYVSGAMENTSASLFMEALQVDRRELLDTNWDEIIAHELFHQWFGDLVTLESWANLPLNESFADYSEYLWFEHKYGADEAALIWQKGMSQYLNESMNKRVPLIRYQYEEKEDMFDNHSYAKGGRVLHMLRNYVGDDAFFTALNLYLTKHKFTAVEVAELRMAFEEVTGEDLTWFFNQWFMQPGHPELLVEHQYQNGKLSLKVNQLQDPKFSPIYRLPLTVSVWQNNQRKDIPITITSAEYDTTIAMASAPELVLFDSKAQLVAEISHEKSKQELLYQYYHTNAYLPKYEALVKLSNNTSDPEVLKMLRDALNDNFWKIRSTALTALEKYAGPQNEAVLEDIKKLALSDKKGIVRGEAILALSESKNDSFLDVYKKGMQDSSYVVAAASIQAYASSGAPDKAEKLAQFEKLKNDDIVLALANYYTDNEVAGKTDWYMRKLDQVKGGTLYFMLQNFGAYLMKLDESKKQQGLTKLAQIARENPAYYIRLAAYQGLSMASESEASKQLRKQIKENEKDKRLKELYEMMP